MFNGHLIIITIIFFFFKIKIGDGESGTNFITISNFRSVKSYQLFHGFIVLLKAEDAAIGRLID